jgi:hypothetical protein
LTTGVEMTDSNRRTKATKSKTVKGVAGLNMMAERANCTPGSPVATLTTARRGFWR